MDEMKITLRSLSDVIMWIAGTGAVTINWGDKTKETYTLSVYHENDWFLDWWLENESVKYVYSHVYSETSSRNIIITGENITHLNFDGNRLDSLKITNNNVLKSLSCRRTQLSNLDVSNSLTLKELYCSDNRLTKLDVSNNAELTELDCSDNRLTSLDVSKNMALTKLNCRFNELKSLDLSANIALKKLNCSCNQLTGLDISANIALTKLNCSGNQIIKNMENLENKNFGKIINFGDYNKYRNTLSEIMDDMTNLSEDIEEGMFNLACLGKWKEWDEQQPVGSEFDLTEDMLRNTGDKNIDLLWELLDKIADVKEKIRVHPQTEPEEASKEEEKGAFFSQENLKIIENHFHALIIERAKEGRSMTAKFLADENKKLPDILADEAIIGRAWYPVPGMYGGFAYSLTKRGGKPLLKVSSWSRVVGGSGQRHEITTDGCVLVEKGHV
jgi:hypothetical protein